MLHMDRSVEYEQRGVKPTLIFAGKHKTDGNSLGPLPEDVHKELQAEVSKFYDQFVAVVAEGRGERLSVDAARATEARILIGEDAIAAGLADRVGSFADLQPKATAAARTSQTRRSRMSDPKGSPAAENAGVSQEDHNRAVTDARTEGEKTGAGNERERIRGILNHEAAANRPRQAQALALDTNLSIAEAAAVMSASAEENGGLSAEATGGPEIGSSASSTQGVASIRDRLKAAQAERNKRVTG